MKSSSSSSYMQCRAVSMVSSYCSCMYLRKLSELRELLPKTPVLACTATATSAVQKDICSSLQLKNPEIIRLSFNRYN